MAKLGKQLNLLDVTCIGAGAMVSSGLFVLPGIAFAQVGPAVILAYAIACLLIVPAMLVQAELATAMPKAGGTYVFIERSLGPLAGTFAGFLNWISIALKAAFALVGLGAITQQFFPEIGEIGIKAVAIAGCLAFTIVNLVSVKSSGKLQVFLVLILVGILVYHGFAGFPEVEGDLLFPFFTTDFHSVLAVSGLVFVSFGGLTKVASLGEEMVNPSRDLPLGMFLAWLIVSVLYLVIVFVVVGTVPAEMLSGSLVPVGLSARTVLGPVGMVLIDVAAGFAFITTANAGIMSASRTPLGMSRDGLLPEALSKTSEKFGTPQTSIFFTCGFIVAIIALLSIEDLVKTASTIMILLFVCLIIALITLRLSKIQSYQPPFKTPLFPYLPVAASLVYLLLIVEMGIVPLGITAAFGLVSAFWYLFYVRPRIERESAFVHLVKTVAEKPLQRLELEDELRQISLERVAPEINYFHERVTSCPVLEIEGEIEASELYKRVALSLSPSTGLSEEKLLQYLLKREFESSTILRPEISMPLVIVEEPSINELLLVRAKEGVWFSHLHQPVKAAFVFVGSIDCKNFHLRALMRLAHIIDSPEFMERWLNARDEDQLRDVILVQK